MTCRTRARTVERTPGWSLMTRETVDRETAASSAISSMVRRVTRAFSSAETVLSGGLERLDYAAQLEPLPAPAILRRRAVACQVAWERSQCWPLTASRHLRKSLLTIGRPPPAARGCSHRSATGQLPTSPRAAGARRPLGGPPAPAHRTPRPRCWLPRARRAAASRAGSRPRPGRRRRERSRPARATAALRAARPRRRAPGGAGQGWYPGTD